MIRFTMPEPSLSVSDQIRILHRQFEEFLHSEALESLLSLLKVDAHSLGSVYNGRRREDGKICETQEIAPLQELEEKREVLYPLFQELGFLGINRPLRQEYSHILVLGGSMNVCQLRTQYADGLVSSSTHFVDGLTAFRPINPIERSAASYSSPCDTEFGCMCDIFTRVFDLTFDDEQFCGDRNLNRICSIRTLRSSQNRPRYRVYAAPSSEPQTRRADTGDTLSFYLSQETLEQSDSILAITSNQYCNRQFVQLAFQLMKNRQPVFLDVVGCKTGEQIDTPQKYNPFQYLQTLIGILDWITRFDECFH